MGQPLDPVRRMFQESSSAIVLLDERGWIVEANESFRLVFESITGRALDSIEESLIEFFRERDAFRLAYHFNRLAAGTARSATIDTSFRASGGESRWMRIRAWAVEEVVGAAPNDRGPFVACTIEDQTERRQEEKRLLEAKEHAEKATETKSLFLANMSHEIRTPIQTVIGMTELLQDTKLDREQEEYARQVKFSAEVLLSLINDILDYSKIEANKLQLERLDFDLETTVEQAVDLISLEAHKKGLEITVDIAADAPELIKGDPTRLRQIIVNLVKNAVKFTRQGGIVVSAAVVDRDGKKAVNISVADTGIGVPPEMRPRLFTTFFQGDASTTRRFGGTGLGLAISRHLVELMGGCIGMVPNEGGGAVFYIDLPIEGAVFGTRRTSLDVDLQTRVLVVDDRSESRRAVVSYLTGFGVRLVDEASSGAEALQRLASAAASGTPYNLCLIDMVMPEMDGWRLAAEINKNHAINSSRLVLMVPQGTLGADAKMTLLKWFNAYINKPVKRRDLAEVLQVAEDVIDLEDAAGDDDAAEVSTVAGEVPVTTGSMEPEASPLDKKAVVPGELGNIMVVEDHPVNQKLFGIILERLGYNATIANDGVEALETVGKSDFDLIFMDIQMPRMNGYEATTKLRELGYRIPIIAVTASALADERERCLAAGLSDVLVKPFRRQEIEDALQKWLPNAAAARKARPPRSEKAEAGPPEPVPGTPPGAVPDGYVPGMAINEEELIETFLGNREIVLPLLARFMERTELQIAAMPGLLEKGDWETLRREAHTIKGSALNLRAGGLGNAAAKAEIAAKDQLKEESAAAIAAIEPAYRAFKMDAQAILGRSGK